MYRTAHRRGHTLARFGAGLALVVGLCPAHAAWQFDVDTGFVYDSNLNRAYEPADIRADTAFTLDAAAGQFFALSGRDGLTVSARARTELYYRFDGLDEVGVGAQAIYRHKFGLGYAAPWVAIGVAAAYDDYR
jgi:hypothetical protein